MAWKDEAFTLFDRWAELYGPSSVSNKLLRDISDTYYLMNIVDNDYKDSTGIFEIFNVQETAIN